MIRAASAWTTCGLSRGDPARMGRRSVRLLSLLVSVFEIAFSTLCSVSVTAMARSV